jgi:putative chitinase
MANLLHETANFVFMKELASGEAYNNRHDLGNGPHDGPKFRGAGVLQLTGRYNYQQLANDVDDPQVMTGVDYVAERYPFTSAASWIKHNNLLHLAERGEFELVCVRINGGKHGYADRCAKYAICQDVMR